MDIDKIDWRTRRLRYALACYQAFYNDSGRLGRSWRKVADDIAATGPEDYHLDDEIIRQFVVGDPKKPWKVRVPEAVHFEVIERFFIGLKLLPAEEPNAGHATDFDAPERLARYLMQNVDREPIRAPAGVSGTYERFGVHGAQPAMISYSFTRPLDDSVLLHVTESVMHFDVERMPNKLFDQDERWSHCVARLEYSGWAIQTPEGIIMAFLKDPATRANRYLTLLAHDGNLEVEAGQLVFLTGDYPLSSDDVPDVTASAKAALAARVLVLKRQPEAMLDARQERARLEAGEFGGGTLKTFRDDQAVRQHVHEIRSLSAESEGSGRRLFFLSASTGKTRAFEIGTAWRTPVDSVDPATGGTIVHRAAQTGARGIIREAMRAGYTAWLARDGQGRLASEFAVMFGHDAVVAPFLLRKEALAAQAAGIDLLKLGP